MTFNKSHTPETREKIRATLKRKHASGELVSHFSVNHPRTGNPNPMPEEVKEKLRMKALERVAQRSEDGKFHPRVGKAEKKILDAMEKELETEIKRQFFVRGYYVDGYAPELNMVIEIDERYHKNQSLQEREMNREAFITAELNNCEFLRVEV